MSYKNVIYVSLVSNNLSNYGRRHFKLFTNCLVLWDTLYVPYNECPLHNEDVLH